VTGKSYQAAMRDDIFAPSGATSFALARGTLAERLPDEVAYHHAGAQTAPYQIPITRMDAHGGWIATSADLVRVGLRADGYATVPDLLAPATVTAMTTATAAPRPNGDPSGYGMGWAVNNIPNWWHDGYLDGTTSILVRTAPRYGTSGTDEFVWAAITNSTNADRATNLNIDDLMYRIVNGVQTWPNIDLLG
jgi:CubicO group peptidase (beta-lactamase class C family)